jgi:hypothetical protein
MSVFSRHRKAEKAVQNKTVMPPNEERLCRGSHKWNGIVPKVDPDKHEIQNTDMIGKRCDCGHLLYATEELCGCPTNKYWKIYYE